MMTVGAVLTACVTTGCSSGDAPAARRVGDAVYLGAVDGYVRLPGVGVQWVRSALERTAEAERWERVTNEESGTNHSAAEHSLLLLKHVYRDPDGREILFDWPAETGHDPVLLVTADRGIRERVTGLVGVNILRLRDGKGLAAGL